MHSNKLDKIINPFLKIGLKDFENAELVNTFVTKQ